MSVLDQIETKKNNETVISPEIKSLLSRVKGQLNFFQTVGPDYMYMDDYNTELEALYNQTAELIHSDEQDSTVLLLGVLKYFKEDLTSYTIIHKKVVEMIKTASKVKSTIDPLGRIGL